MDSLALPELLAISWMALVLARLRRHQAAYMGHLWTVGMALIVVEGVARILYLMPLTAGLHAAMHVVALDTYYLAGVFFFRSATVQMRVHRHSDLYVAIGSSAPLVLLTMYGANVHSRAWFLGIAAMGFVVSLGAAAWLKRGPVHWAFHALIWCPILLMAAAGSFRYVTYLSLFFIYAATAVGFLFQLPRERKGRAVVVAGFGIWSLCFLTHPWIAEVHTAWLPMAENIWDLQKFLVVFGLLTVSLEEQSATNEYQALHDTLTGLPNRRLFEDRLEQSLARADRQGTRVVLFYMDLNGFKQVNDTLGHEAGDELLREVARRLQVATRQTDTLARVGGDEFYLIVNEFNVLGGDATDVPAPHVREQAKRLAETFRQAVEQAPFTLSVGGTVHRLRPQVSVGSVVYPDEGLDRKTLCRKADENMYTDKKRRTGSMLELAAG